MKDRKDEKVVVAYCHPGMVHAGFHESLLDLLVYDVAFNRRIVNGGGRLGVQASANLAAPRNNVVKNFLVNSEADWLWFLDSDMTFAPDTLEKLLEFANPEPTAERYAPIVGGLCFSIDEGQIFPTLYGLVGTEDDPKVVRYHEWPPDSMMQIAATGTACLLMHRSALLTIAKKGFNPTFPWFQETEHRGKPVGEDITFCWRAGLCEIPVYVNTAVHVGHIKERQLDIDTYFVQRGLLSPAHEGVGQ